MPKKLQKSLQDYLHKIKNPTQNIQLSSNRILRGCRHPKTLSFAIARNQNEGHIEDGDHKDPDGTAATLSDVDRFLFENFKSLFINDDDYGDYDDQKIKSRDRRGNQAQSSNRILFESSRTMDPPLDLCGHSHRLFEGRGSSAGSFMDEPRSKLTTTSEDMGSSSTSTNCTLDHSATSCNDLKHVRLPNDSIAIITYSSSPCDDFRRSMREMVEEKLQHNGKVDWDFMEELLLCYLNLNEKSSHKFILSAFVDLTVGLRKNSDKVSARSPSPHSRIATERRPRRSKTLT